MSAKKPFLLGGFRADGKCLYFFGPSELQAEIDTDDVDSRAVAKVAKRMVAILNKHWNDPEVK